MILRNESSDFAHYILFTLSSIQFYHRLLHLYLQCYHYILPHLIITFFFSIQIFYNFFFSHIFLQFFLYLHSISSTILITSDDITKPLWLLRHSGWPPNLAWLLICLTICRLWNRRVIWQLLTICCLIFTISWIILTIIWLRHHHTRCTSFPYWYQRWAYLIHVTFFQFSVIIFDFVSYSPKMAIYSAKVALSFSGIISTLNTVAHSEFSRSRCRHLFTSVRRFHCWFQ